MDVGPQRVLYKVIDIDGPFSSHADKYYNVLILFKWFPHVEVGTAQLPWTSDKNT